MNLAWASQVAQTAIDPAHAQVHEAASKVPGGWETVRFAVLIGLAVIALVTAKQWIKFFKGIWKRKEKEE